MRQGPLTLHGVWKLLASGLAALGLLAASLVPANGATVELVSNGSRAEHIIALTFDDGVSPANCRRILAILVDEHVPATFFPLAEAMRLDPGFWRLAAEAGYPIGNHTLSHPQMPRLDRAAQLSQITNGRALAESIIGRPTLRVFRPPYGAYNADTLTAAATAGYGTVLLWDVSDRDTSPHGHLPAMLAAAELGTNGSVVLLHCGPNATPYLLRPLIDYYRGRGFRFVTIPQLLHLPWHPGHTSVVTPSQVLAGLSPLPSVPPGGPITGPNGYSPSPSVSLPTPSPSLTSPLASPESGSPSASGGPSGSSPSAGSLGSPSPAGPSASTTPGPDRGTTTGGGNASIVILALLGLAALAGIGALVVIARTRGVR